jgi:hypothetical protein
MDQMGFGIGLWYTTLNTFKQLEFKKLYLRNASRRETAAGWHSAAAPQPHGE